MKISHVIFDIDAFGITRRSLKILRNTLAEKASHRICVFEIPTNELCCGFLILDWEWQNAAYTGDGFRADRGGEGGAGYKTAEAIFQVFGIQPLPWDPINLEPILTGAVPEERAEDYLKGMFQKIADEVSESQFKRPVDSQPGYTRA